MEVWVIVQIASAVMCLAAYAMAQTGRWDRLKWQFLSANMVGSAGLFLTAFTAGQFGFVVLECFWFFFTVLPVLKKKFK